MTSIKLGQCISCLAVLLGSLACGNGGTEESKTVGALANATGVAPPAEAGAPENDGQGLAGTVLRQRAALLALADHALAGNAAQREQLNDLLQQSEESLQDASSQKQLVELLYTLGRFGRGPEADNGFIDDPDVLRALASALSSEVKEVAGRALTYLLDYGRSDPLAQVAEEVRQGLGDKLGANEVRLLALLPQTVGQREELLARLDLGMDVRARLGEPEAEAEILQAFQRATDYSKKRSAAKALGYAATPACIKALHAEMGTKLANRTPYFERSLRCDLIEQLVRAIPTEETYAVKYQRILRQGEDLYGLERTRDFLAEVDLWTVLEHQAPRDYSDASPLLLRKLIVKRPLKR